MGAKLDKAKLTELWRKGFTVPEISKMMNAKIDSIYKLAHRIGLPKRKQGKASILEDPEKRKWFIKNYPEMSNGTISVFLNISDDYIGNLARKLGLKKSEAYWEGIREYHRRKMREFHQSKKGDKEYYSYAERPRVNGRFVKRVQ